MVRLLKAFRCKGYIFEPTLGFTLAAAVGLAVTLSLGVWQLERLAWKEGLIQERQAAFEREAVPLAEVANPAAEPYRRVTLRGIFRHDREFYQGALSRRGNPGYHILTPLEREGGGVLLVNRGWVPLELKAPQTRPDGQIDGLVDIEGVIRHDAGRPGRFVPDNRPGENFWFYVDLKAMSAFVGGDDLGDYYIEAGEQANPGGFPIGGQTRIYLRNDHLQYALTWFALTLGLIGVYGVYSTRKET